MNYYPFHLGDYAAHTAHLEPMEDLAYRRMLDAYYLRESPLPSDPKEVARLIRLRGNVEDVDAVLREFFTPTDDGWRHTRCDEEIERMQDKQAKARASAAASVNARAAKAKQTLNERSTNAERADSVGSTEVELPTPTPTPTPKEETKPSDIETAREEIASAESAVLGSDPGDVATATAFLASLAAGPPEPMGALQEPTPYGHMAVELRRKGVRVSSAHPDLVALVDDGYTVPEVVESLAIVSMQPTAPKPMSMGYLAAAARTQREIGKRPKRAEAAWWATEQATVAKGAEFGLSPRSGEDWQAFRARIRAAISNREAA